MQEEIKAAQTTVENPTEKPTEGQSTTPEGGNADPVKKPDEVVEQTKQSEEENREQARRRREIERQQALEKRELETAIRITGGLNPFTYEKIEDRADLDEFYLMKEIEKNGGDPIADFAKYQKQKRKEGKDLALKQEMSEEQVRKDWQDFTAAHPDISLKTLMADEKFVDYADGKIGNKPLAQIYDGYKKFTAAETKQPEKKPEFVKETPGALGQTPPANPEIYSKDSYEKLVSNPKALRALSEEQFKKLMKSQEYYAKQK